MSEKTKSAQELPVKRKGGMPMFVPTDEQRNVVRKLSGYGLPHEQIAALVGRGIDRDTLAKHFRQELDEGKAAASERIGATLFEKAMSGDTASLIWWTKAQMRWTSLQQIQVQSDQRISIVSALAEAEGRVIEGEVVPTGSQDMSGSIDMTGSAPALEPASQSRMVPAQDGLGSPLAHPQVQVEGLDASDAPMGRDGFDPDSIPQFAPDGP